MAGNLFEWVSSLYMPYPYDANDGREDMSSSHDRVLRGGSWYLNESYVRSSYRDKNPPADTFNAIGFRCARTP
jgi:formylglycine-generating enzyme required for sulfatase activity